MQPLYIYGKHEIVKKKKHFPGDASLAKYSKSLSKLPEGYKHNDSFGVPHTMHTFKHSGVKEIPYCCFAGQISTTDETINSVNG